MGKPKRKPRPAMPHWWWLDSDECWFCRNRNNCNQCKVARQSYKSGGKLAREKDRRANDAAE